MISEDWLTHDSIDQAKIDPEIQPVLRTSFQKAHFRLEVNQSKDCGTGSIAFQQFSVVLGPPVGFEKWLPEGTRQIKSEWVKIL